MTNLAPDLRNVNLFLVGMMGAGKSTTGQVLAQRLAYHFFDTDALIVQATGQSVDAIFQTHGESGFRKIETSVLAELASYRNLVIATGGGIVLTPQNWSHLRHGLVVWLDVDLPTLWTRLNQDQSRPLLKTPDPRATLAALLEARRSLYAQADVRVAVPGEASPEQVAERVFAAIAPVLRRD
ncbi:shikimate kinase [Lyngbya confervoides]|uniref:shikimate kinase n=1 Tax=Lyngbya confervoides TaxID=207921 RepID=UPI001F422163